MDKEYKEQTIIMLNKDSVIALQKCGLPLLTKEELEIELQANLEEAI